MPLHKAVGLFCGAADCPDIVFSKFLVNARTFIWISILSTPPPPSLFSGLSFRPPSTHFCGTRLQPGIWGKNGSFLLFLDLPFLHVPMGRGGVTPALIGLVWPLSCVHAPLQCSAPLWNSFYAVSFEPPSIKFVLYSNYSYSWSRHSDYMLLNTCSTQH